MAMSPDTSIKNTPPPSLIAKVRVFVPIFMPNTQNAKSEFDYVVGSTLKLERGCIVEVSFANRIIWGVVYECNYETEIEHSKLKPILAVSSASLINNATLEFLNQVSEWTMAPFGQILRMMLCVPNALKSDAPVMCYGCLLYTSPSPRDRTRSRMPSSA